ncbi:hypothetical protein M9979_11160 [Sphingomonas sp. RP10(2022)]|uniref:Uncharacterized protein n=1 Tax=Sphingomonas liriopis TaxID=2949094 RepID=A0A9X2HQS1_9SPHN|nr:hypothetical protein [Sphingomonas liriopis]MCP3735428.1 hypothetical protein [Sphingomonas liriopis]
MIRYPHAVLAAAGLIAVPAAAQIAPLFTGTWKADIATAKLPAKPDVFELKDGRYTCSSCVPAIAVKADGTPQAATGHDYWDHIAVKAVDPTTISYSFYRAGKLTSANTDTVSADGNTLTSRWRSSDNVKKLEQSGTSTETRIAPAAPGAHAASGSWKPAEIKAVSDSNLIIQIKETPATFSWTQPSGETYTAKFGGPAVPFVGDPAKTMVKVRRIDARTVEETDTRAGKVVIVYTLTLQPDGQTLGVKVDNRKDGTKTEFTAHRQ